VLCVIGAFLGRVQTSARNNGRIDFVSRTVQSTVEVLAIPLSRLVDGVENVGSGIIHSSDLREENRRLKLLEQSAMLYQERVDYYDREFNRLRKLLELPPIPGRTRIPASTVGIFPTENRLTLNVGSEKGIKPGMPVISGDGLAGIIQVVANGRSQMLLISSPQLAVGALVKRDPPTAAILRGETQSSLILEFVELKSNVQVGDLVVTSGYSVNIPPGIPIGKIFQVQDNVEFGTRSCQVFPFVQVGSIREVYVLK
jgi:rod shape-determining protein MreC